MPHLLLIAHNLRSCHNVGSLLRTAEGLGVKEVLLSGYTPYPQHENDSRMPHIAAKLDRQISKTALNAQKLIRWQHMDTIEEVFAYVTAQGIPVIAVEQSPQAIALPSFKPPKKLALLVGRETEGVEPEILARCNAILEIPMPGKKESFNVVQAAAMAMYHCAFTPFKA